MLVKIDRVWIDADRVYNVEIYGKKLEIKSIVTDEIQLTTVTHVDDDDHAQRIVDKINEARSN